MAIINSVSSLGGLVRRQILSRSVEPSAVSLSWQVSSRWQVGPALIGALSSPEHGNERGLWATGATLVAFALLIARFPADTDIFDGAPAGAAGRGQKREGGELSRLLFFS